MSVKDLIHPVSYSNSTWFCDLYNPEVSPPIQDLKELKILKKNHLLCLGTLTHCKVVNHCSSHAEVPAEQVQKNGAEGRSAGEP